MVNQKAIRRSEATIGDRQRALGPKLRHRQVRFPNPDRDKEKKRTNNRNRSNKKKEVSISDPVNVRFLLNGLYFHATEHKFDGDEFLKRPSLCEKAHYSDACSTCPHKNSRGWPSKAEDVRYYLVYNLDADGETFTRNDKDFLVNPFQWLRVTPGEGNINWTTLDEWAEKGYLKKKVIQFRESGFKVLTPVILPQEELEEDYGGGMPDKDSVYWKQVKGYTEDDFFGHVGLLFDKFDFDEFGVDEPDLDDDEDIEVERKSKGSSRRSNARNEEDEEEEPRNRKRSSKRRQDSDDDESEDEEEEERPSRSRRSSSKKVEEDEDEKPRRRKQVKDEEEDEEEEKPTRRSSRRASKSEDNDDEEEESEDDGDDDERPSRRRR